MYIKKSVFDAWLDKAPGGPLFDLIHAGADNGDRPIDMPVGTEALQTIPLLYDKFVAANYLVEKAKVKSTQKM
jgi:hypothetical protein